LSCQALAAPTGDRAAQQLQAPFIADLRDEARFVPRLQLNRVRQQGLPLPVSGTKK